MQFQWSDPTYKPIDIIETIRNDMVIQLGGNHLLNKFGDKAQAWHRWVEFYFDILYLTLVRGNRNYHDLVLIIWLIFNMLFWLTNDVGTLWTSLGYIQTMDQ